MTCGERIRKKRKELGLTQGNLGEKVGLSFGSISKYEKDECSISAEKLLEIANVLRTSVDYLLGNTSISNPKKTIEDICLKYQLTETEYNMIFNDLINNRIINMDLLNSNNSKIQRIYSEIINIYSMYFNNNNDNINKIDNVFVDMLKTIDKDKIIYKDKININEISNVFPIPEGIVKIPIVGKIAAGLPILATENIVDYYFAPASKIKQDFEYFYLRVQR